MCFDWDAVENAANIRKDRVAFHDAACVFDDADRADLDLTEDDYGEVRLETIGCSDLTRQFLLSVNFTVRFPETLRIIPARRADPQDIRTHDVQSQLIDAPECRRHEEMDAAAVIEAGTDWACLEAMTDEENRANAESDPDAVILTLDERRRLRRVPDPRAIRERLGLTQRAFADRFGIPVGTMRDWEQGRRFIDSTARTLLRTVALAPDVVAQANQPDARLPGPIPAEPAVPNGTRLP